MKVDPRRLADHPLIETVGTADGWSQWAQRADYSGELQASLFVDYHGAALDLALAGAGIALISSLLAGPSLAAGCLRRIHPQALPSRDGYFLATRDPKGKTTRAFTRWLKQELG